MAAEQQLRALESRVEYIYRWITDTILPQLRGAQQGVRGVYQQPTTTIQSSGEGVFWCAPSSSIPAASGVPGTGTPGGPVTANVYQMQSGAYVLVASSASIYNGMLSATIAGRVLAVCLNGDGTYSAPGQSCT